MAITDKEKEAIEELLARTNELTGSLMSNIYKDFYGTGKMPSPETVKEGSDGNEKVPNGETGRNTGHPGDQQTGQTDQKEAEAEQTKETEASSAETRPAEPEKTGEEQLRELIGLSNIKHDVSELASLMKMQKLRKENGLNYVPTSKHLVFAGNPGTGKTSVARILAKIYKEIGVLSKGQLVEVDRSGLVAGYVGQTAVKTQEKIEEALGGILFVDEAYALAKEGNDFGQEAIDTILKAMEDNRDDFVVIVAGYTKPMERFVASNPGLKSRFNKYLYFEDYTREELEKIFDLQCSKYHYHLTEKAREEVTKRIDEVLQNKDENFANAREIRNLFEEIITNQSTRVVQMENPTVEDLTEILPEDIYDDACGEKTTDKSESNGIEESEVNNSGEDTDHTGKENE